MAIVRKNPSSIPPTSWIVDHSAALRSLRMKPRISDPMMPAASVTRSASVPPANACQRMAYTPRVGTVAGRKRARYACAPVYPVTRPADRRLRTLRVREDERVGCRADHGDDRGARRRGVHLLDPVAHRLRAGREDHDHGEVGNGLDRRQRTRRPIQVRWNDLPQISAEAPQPAGAAGDVAEIGGPFGHDGTQLRIQVEAARSREWCRWAARR